jgi:hypothetical protein
MRTEKPKRYRGARRTAKVGSIEKIIESIFKLPGGSVSIHNKDGSNTKSNKRIGKLRKGYE